MKSIFYTLTLLIFFEGANAQITSSVIRANFGIEADLSANYYNQAVLPDNDDWFNNYPQYSTGIGVIDTTGAAAMKSLYAWSIPSRSQTFYRTMSVPPYTVVNNQLELDAVFIRDYHGNDSTAFAAGASKNGMSPQNWYCPVSQSIPDKNEILDMMVHVRRAGPNVTDSLWMFGGLSIENTTGDRYFDFEMYQTDLYYDRSALQFFGYGPDAGHTSWTFDASGKIIKPGDIIFSAEYSSSNLTAIEAHIWIDKATMLITPVAFSWTGSFDGASSGAQYGYAGITPKTAGAFYTGTENSRSTWAGAFSLIRGDNSVVTAYTINQFMEFGVNLTKLGLDPSTLLGGNSCGIPFRRILVKTRASTSFTAALKDFVAPFAFFIAPKTALAVDTTAQCGIVGASDIRLINPSKTSVYSWSTSNGHIVSNYGDTTITVDSPGTYIVTQKLQAGCPIYSADTVVIKFNPQCILLQNAINNLSGKILNREAQLNWSVNLNRAIQYFEIEKSTDGYHFITVASVDTHSPYADIADYNLIDNLENITGSSLFYRIKIAGFNGQVSYSKIIRLFNGGQAQAIINISPNPASDLMRINISSTTDENMELGIYDFAGRLMKTLNLAINKGTNELVILNLQNWQSGLYSVKIMMGNYIFIKKIMIAK